MKITSKERFDLIRSIQEIDRNLASRNFPKRSVQVPTSSPKKIPWIQLLKDFRWSAGCYTQDVMRGKNIPNIAAHCGVVTGILMILDD